ncbi:MAG TPA: hypothetical protein VM487_01970 [Phycisphaerae bacterium]|nr:hypothetical protein [Phycisphaerae bacterium]
MSRPSKLTPELQAALCALLSVGIHHDVACASVGISRRSLSNWLRQGNADEEAGVDSPYVDLMVAIRSAEAACEVKDLETIGEASKSDWKAAAWREERRHPKRWGQQISVRVEDELKGFLRVAERVLETEVFCVLLEEIAAGDSEGEAS